MAVEQPAAKKKQLVPVNDYGIPIGEYHHHAKLSDAQVEDIRDLYELGLEDPSRKIGYRTLAKQFGVSKRTIRDIVHFNRRNQHAAEWRRR